MVPGISFISMVFAANSPSLDGGLFLPILLSITENLFRAKNPVFGFFRKNFSGNSRGRGLSCFSVD